MTTSHRVAAQSPGTRLKVELIQFLYRAIIPPVVAYVESFHAQRGQASP
jgi:hypothetical protein